MNALLMHIPTVGFLLLTASLLFVALFDFSKRPDGVTIAAIYLAGTTQALSILVDPIAEHGSTAATPYHDMVNGIANPACFALFFYAVIERRRAESLPRPAKWLLAYCLALMISGVLNEASFARDWLLFPGLLWVALSRPLAMPRLLFHLRWTLRVSMFGSLYLLATHYAEVVFVDNGRELFGIAQLSGTTPHPNQLGPLAAVALIVELQRLDDRRRSKLAVTAATICLVLAQSRAGWVALALVGLLYFGRTAVARWLLYAGAVGGTAWAVSWLAGNSLIGELNGRAAVWQISLRLFRESNPLIGGGPGVFANYVQSGSQDRVASAVGQAHNQILNGLTAGGIVGAVVVTGFLLSLAGEARRRLRTGQRLPAAVAIVLLSTCLVEAPIGLGRTAFTYIALVSVLLLKADPATQVKDDRPQEPEGAIRPTGVVLSR